MPLDDQFVIACEDVPDALRDYMSRYQENTLSALDIISMRARIRHSATRKHTINYAEHKRFHPYNRLGLPIQTRVAPENYIKTSRLATPPNNERTPIIPSILSDPHMTRLENTEEVTLTSGQLIVYGIDTIARRFNMKERPRLLLKNAAVDPDDLDGVMMSKTVKWLDGPLKGKITTLRKSVKEVLGMECNAYLQLCTNKHGKEMKLDTQRVKKGGSGFRNLIVA